LIRLILMDVDGTLVGSDGVHPSTWPAVEEARALGIHLGLATGRIGRGIAEHYARRVSPLGLHVFQNGAVISRPGQAAERKRPMPPDSFRALVGLSRHEHQPLEAYGERNFYLEFHTDLTRRHAEVLELEPVIGDLLAIEEPVVRCQWVIHESVWPHFRALTEPLEGLAIHPATGPWSPGTLFVNLTARDATKAAALGWLAHHHGLERSEVAMIGDAENDLEAMDAAGLAIAMGNASREVKSRAGAVVRDVDAGGLAEAIRLAMR
jgi:Cof subfamily protein (haloacid dehalogenase superfamily)